MSSIDPNTFLFFGCWNNIDCKYKYIYRDIVLQSIKSFETDVDNVFIAGDNWYNLLVNNSKELESIITDEVKGDKDIEITHYLTPVLISGYYALYNMNKNIYICVGNHDEVEDGQEDMGLTKYTKKNCMIDTQKYYLKKINDSIKTNPEDKKEYSDYTDADILTNPAIQFINKDKAPSLEKLKQLNEEYTQELEKAQGNKNEINLYSGNHIEIIDNEESSYIVMIINTNILSLEYIEEIKNKIEIKLQEYGIEFFRQFEKEVLDKIQSDSKEPSKYNRDKDINKVKQLFVMGHIPLFNDKKDAINKNSEIPDEIFTALYDMLVKYDCIYLCADTHNFNIMKITNTQNSKSLIQITSGTGGAKPDLIVEKTGMDYFATASHGSKSKSNSKIVNIDNYNIHYNSINSYGYCKLIKQSDKLVVIYNKIIDAAKQKRGTQEIQYSKYFYIIKNNDVSYYTVRENKELFKNIEENIEKMAKASSFYRDVYCADGYMNMNHVIKSEKSASDKQVICFNKAYKNKKKKNKKPEKTSEIKEEA